MTFELSSKYSTMTAESFVGAQHGLNEDISRYDLNYIIESCNLTSEPRTDSSNAPEFGQ